MEIAVLLIRAANAVLWTLVVVRILSNDVPVSRLARRLISVVIGFGMWILVIGGLTPFGFDGEIARTIYTVFTAFAGLIALGIFSTADASAKEVTDE